MKEVFCSEMAGILSKSDLELPTVAGLTNCYYNSPKNGDATDLTIRTGLFQCVFQERGAHLGQLHEATFFSVHTPPRCPMDQNF